MFLWICELVVHRVLYEILSEERGNERGWIWKIKRKVIKSLVCKFACVRLRWEERERERWTMAWNVKWLSNVIAQPTSQSHIAWSYDNLSAYLHPSIPAMFCILYSFICPTTYNYILSLYLYYQPVLTVTDLLTLAIEWIQILYYRVFTLSHFIWVWIFHWHIHKPLQNS